MSGFDLSYDSDDDVLEVTFEIFDEQFSRTVTLNDNILLFTDLSGRAVWGLTLYDYARLLRVGETVFTALGDLSDEQIEDILALIVEPPVALFLELTDSEALLARVLSPNLGSLILD
jgi:hypothetical protein